LQIVTKDDVAARLAPDLLPWERQPDEPEAAWHAFKDFLESEKRRVSDHGPSARNWSSKWLWSTRAHEYDVHMARVDLEEQVRYRRRMMERHRRVGAVAQGKAVEWLNTLTPEKIAKWTPADATRLLQVSVQIEREACAGASLEDLPDPYGEPAGEGSLGQRLLDAGLNMEMSELARLIHEKSRPPPVNPPEPPRQAQERPAPLEPEPGGEPPSPSIWGDRQPYVRGPK
jgi:hypothetical protein